MDDARFRPTPRQALGHGLYLGALGAAAGLTAALAVTTLAAGPPGWVWMVLVTVPPLLGVLVAVSDQRRTRTVADARGIRTGDRAEPWSSVADVRAERRGGRTEVAVYLHCGRRVRLDAPYSGELFAADPRFDSKLSRVAHLWRSHGWVGAGYSDING